MDEHVVYREVIADGREVCVIPRMFNTIVVIGRAGAFTYDDQW